MGKLNEYFPETVTHPGLTLEEKLSEIGMSQKEFALRTGKPEKTISLVISGQSSFTPDMAIVFEKVLKIPASFWLKRQLLYDEALARHKAKENVALSVPWAMRFPYAEMAKKGWVVPTRNRIDKTENLLNFFGISRASSWERLYMEQERQTSYRISLKNTSEPEVISAWLRQGEIQGKQSEAPSYDSRKFSDRLNDIRGLMVSQPDDFFTELQKICNSAGVKVVYTSCLPHAPVNGCTRWVGDNPLIQLSGRYMRNDIFWFTFFHEAGHILKHGKKEIYIETDGRRYNDLEKEKEADQFAITHTLSEAGEQTIINAMPLMPDEIIKYAHMFNTHPAIIVGRLARKELVHSSYGHDHGFFRNISFEEKN